MTLVERIESLCKQKKYAISRLEKESGLSNGQIGKWKNNQKPSYDKVASVANTLNVSIDWLITGKEFEELSDEEQKLLKLYRQADNRGKKVIMMNAELVNPEQEQQLSDSLIG